MPTSIVPPASDWPSLTPHPGTITWCRAGDPRLLLAAGYALLLQSAHPTVGAGVSEHSQFQRDPWGRLLRTLDYAYTMVLRRPAGRRRDGQSDPLVPQTNQGRQAGRQRYHALEPAAYAWVHATLAEAIVTGHERFGRPFTDDQCERFWAEWRSLGRLLGIRECDLPTDWSSFREYVDGMVARELRRTVAVEEVNAALARPAPPAVVAQYHLIWPIARVQLGHFLGLSTVGLLPPDATSALWASLDTCQ